MDAILKERLAVALCAADMSCGYISVTPILDNRDELIESQHVLYNELLSDIENKLTPESIGIGHEIQDEQWCSAIELVSADIISEAISLDPVLYDRNDRVRERIEFYFNYLKKYFSFEMADIIRSQNKQMIESVAPLGNSNVITNSITLPSEKNNRLARNKGKRKRR